MRGYTGLFNKFKHERRLTYKIILRVLTLGSIITTVEKINYNVLSEKYKIKASTLRKKKERALEKLSRLIPKKSILKMYYEEAV